MKLKRVLAILLAILMTVSLCACGGDVEEGGGSGSVEFSNADRDAKIRAEGNEITFLTIGYDGKDTNSPYYKAIEDMKNIYGKTVTLIQCAGDENPIQKVAAQVAAQDPIDVFYFNDQTFLTMYQRGFMAPVDDYIDLTQSWHQLDVMDAYMKMDGKYYGGRVTATPYVMYYNRDLLINNGYDANYPKELYEKGEWTWDKFVEICRECTVKDVIWGLENMYDEAFEASNASTVVKFVDGKYVLDVRSNETRQVMELLQDIFKNNQICGQGYIVGQNKFLMGKSVFHGAYAYEEAVFANMKNDGTINLDIGVVPFPVGPNNTEKKVNYGDASGFAIADGCDAPYTAGMFIDLVGKYQDEQEAAKEALLQPDSKALYDELRKNLFFPNYTAGILKGNGMMGEGAFNMFRFVRDGGDINQAISEYETVYQKEIKDANELLE